MFSNKLSTKAKKLLKHFKRNRQNIRDEFSSVLGIAAFTDLKCRGKRSQARVGEWEIVRNESVWSVRHNSWETHRVIDAQTLSTLVNGRASYSLLH